MRKILLLVALAALVFAAPASTTATKTVTVAITKAAFVPSALTIEVADTVTFTNSDTVNHQVISQDAPFSSPILKPGETFSFTFGKAGKFNYQDALVKNRKGTVTVSATPTPPPPAAGVSLAVAPGAVVYGGTVTISGTISTQKAGEKVDITAQACGGSASHLATVTTTTGGAFTYQAQPTANTSYSAKFKNATSSQAGVQVRPIVRLAKIARRKFSVRVTAGASLVGKYVTFQRYNALASKWTTVRSVALRTAAASTTPLAGTTVTSAIFTVKIKSRVRIRAVLPATQTGGCFLAASSNVARS